MNNYWEECISTAASECGLTLTKDQLQSLASSAESAHKNYGMAFYSPPSTDRTSEIERGWKAKVEAAEATAERYRADFVKNICMRHNCEPSQVTLEGGGRATIQP